MTHPFDEPGDVAKALFDAAANDAATPDQLTVVAQLAQEHAALAARIDKAETWLKDAKIKREQLEATRIPEAMRAAGLKTYETTDGLIVGLKDVVAGSIPEARRPAALAYLRKLGADALIKATLALSFGKGEDKKQQKALKLLEKAGFPVESKETVHPQTLCAWVREYRENPENATKPLDVALLGVYVGVRATVKQRA